VQNRLIKPIRQAFQQEFQYEGAREDAEALAGGVAGISTDGTSGTEGTETANSVEGKAGRGL